MLRSSLRAALCAFLAAAAFTGAQAADANHVGQALVAAANATGQLRLTYDKATAAGDDVTLTNVKLAVGDGNNTLTFPSVVVSGAADRPGGGLTAKRIAFDNGSALSGGAMAKWATGAIDDVVVPSAQDLSDHAKLRPFAKLTLGNVSLMQSAKGTPITVASVAVDVGAVTSDMPTTVHAVASGAKMPAAFIANPVAGAMLSRMGYTEFDATVTLDSVYDTAKNSIAVNALVVDAAKVGKLSLAAKFSGTSIGGVADAKEAADARAAARMDSLSIRFDDAGFTGRMLDMQADLYGGTRDDVRDTLVYGALPLVLNYVQNTAFRAQFMDAASTFLGNPKSFTITAAPAMPVPVGETLRTALHEPLKLPDLLAPQVAANK